MFNDAQDLQFKRVLIGEDVFLWNQNFGSVILIILDLSPFKQVQNSGHSDLSQICERNRQLFHQGINFIPMFVCGQ